MGWPARFRDVNLLYAMEIQTDGPISCRTNTSLNPLDLKVTQPLELYLSLSHTHAHAQGTAAVA